MATIDTYDSYGKRFRFEPPVDIGQHTIDSLGKLVAIAATGPNAHPVLIDGLAVNVNTGLDALHQVDGTKKFTNFLSNAASIRGNNYTVSIE